jgi:hypothetical protein
MDDNRIHQWLKENCEISGCNISINNGIVNVDGDIIIIEQITKIPIKFGIVTENFWCSRNQLTSLEGAPKEVRRNFYCSLNQLTSLEGAPIKVGENFFCSNNQLVSLKGAPRMVGGNFHCDHNQLISLEGAPKEVGNQFNCFHNQLISLKGMPIDVKDFDCDEYLKETYEYKWWKLKRFLKS